jgi:hypothetical protein
VTTFASALRAYGLPESLVIAWRDVLDRAEVRIPEGAFVRIDSPGEDPEVDALLRGPGPPTRVGGAASWHAAFIRGLERVRQAVARAELPAEAYLWHSVVSADREGTVRRCHFVTQTIGNLYDGSALRALTPRPCPLPVCDCHIGYAHLEPLDLYRAFAGGVLERVPAAWPR